MASQEKFPMQTCFIELTGQLGIVNVSGVDAKAFLQGQLTCNMNDITQSQSGLSAHCNLKGRMQGLFRVIQVQESQYWLTMPLTLVPFALKNLQKYALFSKVQMTDSSAMLSVIGIFGDQAKELVAKVCGLPTLSLEVNHCLSVNSEHGLCVICRIPGLTPRYEIYGTHKTILTIECQQALPNIWELLDIQAGLPCVYPQTIDELLPHHVSLDALQGISFNKGCYLGQEIIARMHYKGKIKKHLYHAKILQNEFIPEPGTLILSDPDPVGTVVRASKGFDNSIELLVVLDEQQQGSQNLHLGTFDGPKLAAISRI